MRGSDTGGLFRATGSKGRRHRRPRPFGDKVAASDQMLLVFFFFSLGVEILRIRNVKGGTLESFLHC